MAEGFLAWNLLLLEDRVRRMDERIERIKLRDAQNPFKMHEGRFIKKFRVSPDLALILIDQLSDFLSRQLCTGVPPEIQVLTTLRFYAKGSYQDCVGEHICINLSQASVSRCIHAVTDAINNRLLRTEVKFPQNPEERQIARLKFASAPQPFDGAIGAIDCTYVHILAPSNHEENYVNHHGRHCINVQAIVDPDLKILNINAKWPGARNDAHIWSQSPVRQLMEQCYEHGERRTWLIGDAAYPLEPWLMTPMPNYPGDTRQYHYTKQLCKARNVIERFFGVWKGTWRCLSYQRVLMYDPSFAGRIVNACAVLHNMRLSCGLPVEEFLENDPFVVGPVQYEEFHEENPPEILVPRAIGRRIRNQICRERFRQFRDGDLLHTP